jgi:FkbM family methyltransferase
MNPEPAPYISCPRDGIKAFAEVERYVLGCDYSYVTVLDIGAHVGAYALKALRDFPGSKVVAYEPHPDNFRLLEHNTRGLPVTCVNAAVVGRFPGPGRTLRLLQGFTSLGHALSPLGWQTEQTLDVPGILARELPPADLVKIDTEGSEDAIVRGYPHWPGVRGCILEWHSQDSRRFLLAHLESLGLRKVFELTGSRTGVVGFRRDWH